MKSKTLRKTLIVSGIVIIAIVLAIVGGLIYLDKNAGKIAENFLQKEYQGSEFSKVYEIKYDNISIGLFSGNLKIKNLSIAPRPSFYEADDTLRLKYPHLFDIKLPSLSITGIDENFSLSLKNISLESIVMSRPEIILIDHLTIAKKKQAKALRAQHTKQNKPDQSQEQSYALQSFELKRGSFSYYDHKKQLQVLAAGKINLRIDDLLVEGSPDEAALLNIFKEQVQISIGDFFYPTPKGMYDIRVEDVQKNPGDSSLNITGFELVPNYKKKEFGHKVGKQTDRLQIKVDNILIGGLDFEKYLQEQEVYINRIVITGLFLNAFRDKNVPFNYNRFPKMPQQALAGMEVPLDIRKILVKDSEVLYEQLNEGAGRTGQVPIKKLYATLANVSNIPEQIREFGPMSWDVRTNIFGASTLDVKFQFDENIRKPDFSISGSLQQMNMTAFNQMTEHTEYIRIEEGMIQSMDFEATANGEYMEGELFMLYSDLKIKGLRKAAKKEKEEMGLLSAMANMVIRQFNPPKNKRDEPVSSQIFFVRDKNKGIFNYLAKGIISGIKATILPSVSSPKKRYEKRIEKESKKEARQKKREEKKKKRQSENEDND